jgi:hypothetical protein
MPTMPEHRAPRRRVRRAARVALLVVGLAIMTVSFIALVDEHLVLTGAEPWSYLGAIGIVAVLVALGSPWDTGASTD